MNWTLEQLHSFKAAAEHGSFSAAARALGRAQSVVSTHIAALEAELGLELFDRSTKTPTLTMAGQDLLEEAGEIQRRCRRFDSLAIARYQGEAARMNLVMGQGMPAHLGNMVLAQMAKKWPHIGISLQTLTDGEAWQRVENGAAHMGLIYDDRHISPENCEISWVAAIEQVVVAAHDHPLAQKSKVTLSDLAGCRQIVIGDSSLALPRGVSSSSWWETNDLLVALDMAQRGVGWTILPAPMIQMFASSTPPPGLKKIMPPSPIILSTPDWQVPPANVMLMWNFRHLRHDIVDWLREELISAFRTPLDKIM